MCKQNSIINNFTLFFHVLKSWWQLDKTFCGSLEKNQYIGIISVIFGIDIHYIFQYHNSLNVGEIFADCSSITCRKKINGINDK